MIKGLEKQYFMYRAPSERICNMNLFLKLLESKVAKLIL